MVYTNNRLNTLRSDEALNMVSGRLTDWAEEWIVRFSPPKTKSMYISRRNTTIKCNYQWKEWQLTHNTHKHLGVTLCEYLSWKEHIENITTNEGKWLDVLNALKYKLDRQTIETV